MWRIKTLVIFAKREVHLSPPQVDRESKHPPVICVMLATKAGKPFELRASTVAEYPDLAPPQDFLAVQRIRPKTHNKSFHFVCLSIVPTVAPQSMQTSFPFRSRGVPYLRQGSLADPQSSVVRRMPARLVSAHL
jgi:hypothetical protein